MSESNQGYREIREVSFDILEGWTGEGEFEKAISIGKPIRREIMKLIHSELFKEDEFIATFFDLYAFIICDCLYFIIPANTELVEAAYVAYSGGPVNVNKKGQYIDDQGVPKGESGYNMMRSSEALVGLNAKRWLEGLVEDKVEQR